MTAKSLPTTESACMDSTLWLPRPRGAYLRPQWGVPFVCVRSSEHQPCQPAFTNELRHPHASEARAQCLRCPQPEVRPERIQFCWHMLSLGLIIPHSTDVETPEPRAMQSQLGRGGSHLIRWARPLNCCQGQTGSTAQRHMETLLL